MDINILRNSEFMSAGKHKNGVSGSGPEHRYIRALCALTLNPAGVAPTLAQLAALNEQQRGEFLHLAFSHHVVIRAFQVIERAAGEGGYSGLQDWAAKAVAGERTRIGNALRVMHQICAELENGGCPVVVLRTIDHWPDFGNDIDLYTSANPHDAVRVFQRLDGDLEARSWGDHLAGKWGFVLPGLRETIELRAQCLGHFGEHLAVARRFITRHVTKQVAGYTFFVPAPEERIVAAALRMYGHFHFRVCDFLDTAALVESSALDYSELRRAAEMAGIWPGVSSFLVIVSDCLESYRGRGLELPAEVRAAVPFRGDKVFIARGFIRVPVIPEAAGLYTRQLAAAALRGDLHAMFRLILLPPLRLAAVLARRLPHLQAPDLHSNPKRAISELGN